MNRIQRGATLLEAILVAALMGFIMAYAGQQALLYAERKVMDEKALQVIEDLHSYHDFISSSTLNTSIPIGGEDYAVNPLWRRPLATVPPLTDPDRPEWQAFEALYVSKELSFLKLTSCTADLGVLNTAIYEKYLDCGDRGMDGELKFEGFNLYLKTYTSIAIPLIRSWPFAAHMYYVLQDNIDWDFMVQTAVRLPEIELLDGFRIKSEKIKFTVFNPSDGATWLPNELIQFSLEEYLNADFVGFEAFKELALASGNPIGLEIEIDFLTEGELLKRDGTISMEETASLCWSDGINENVPCIGAIIDELNPDDNAILIQTDLKVDGNLVFKDNAENYRTPVIAKYHAFDGTPQNIEFIQCPKDPNGVVLEEQIALMPSSFSTGTETTSNFTNPESIISRGTRGAGGKHAFTSGLSLEWTRLDAVGIWQVEGAIGFDARYAEENDNSSVARNPRSISFISLQWCE